MADSYLLGVQVETPEGKFVNNGILKVEKNDLKLVYPQMKGTALGGLLLVAFWAVYVFALASPFVLFHVAPITKWDALSEALYALALPVGFIAIVFLGLSFTRRVQIRFPKSVRNVTVLDSRLGGYRILELVVQSDQGTSCPSSYKIQRKHIESNGLPSSLNLSDQSNLRNQRSVTRALRQLDLSALRSTFSFSV